MSQKQSEGQNPNDDGINIDIIEQRTSIDDLSIIHIHVEEDKWYRMRGWSAYLYNKLVESNLTESTKVNRFSDIIQIGIPVESLSKYFKEVVLTKVNNKYFTVDTKDLITFEDITLENYGDILKEYVKKFPKSDKKPLKNRHAHVNEGNSTNYFSDIPHMNTNSPCLSTHRQTVTIPLDTFTKLIMVAEKASEYPISDRNMVENIHFIESIQRASAHALSSLKDFY